MKLFFAKILLYAWGALPFSVVHRIGNFFGWLLYVSNSKLRRVTEINLKLCFPEKSEQERLQLTRQVLKEKAKEIAEAPAIWTKSAKKLLAQYTKISGAEALINDINKRKGVILLGAHMGAFYLTNVYISPKCCGTWLYRPQKGLIEELTKNKRNAYGAKFVPTDNTGVMAIMRELKSGGLVGMSCDHDAGATGGLFAPFFNIPAWTMGLPARLAEKTHAPVYFMFLERLAPGKGFHLHVYPVDAEIYNSDLTIATIAMNKTLEHCVRQFPAQYDWTYKRFRRRQHGEAQIY